VHCEHHFGFSVDQSVLLPAGDQAGIERLVQYMVRCPFSLSRLVKVTDTGQVVYKAEKEACHAFPDPHGDGIASGPKRNFQVFSPLDFLAELTQHIPPKGSHTIRYYGAYSNKSRGMRKKAEVEAAGESTSGCDTNREAPGRSRQTWAMLIKRVYEIDPMVCAKCGSKMAVVSFIEPPQKEVIDKILEHCGLRRSPEARPPPDVDDTVHELDYVDMDTFLTTF